MRRYITTAIDYPNAAPHMGHVNAWDGHLRCPSHGPTLPSKVSSRRGTHETRAFGILFSST